MSGYDMNDNFAEDFLEHYGVKGMKWGVTRDEAVLRRLSGQRVNLRGAPKEERKAFKEQAKKDWKDYKSKTTRKERREDRRRAEEEKLGYILDQVSKDKKTLLQINTPGQMPTLISGKEFVDHLGRGGLVSPKYTELSGFRIGDGKK